MVGWLRRLVDRVRGRQTGDEEAPDATLIAFLVGRISAPQRATSVLTAVEAFQRRPAKERREALPGVYLLLEQYLTDVDPLGAYTRPQLRALVEQKFPTLRAIDGFRVIFEPLAYQEVHLGRALLESILRRAIEVLGATEENFLLAMRDWIENVPTDAALPAPLQIAADLPETHQDWAALLIELSQVLFEHLERAIGEAAGRIYEGAYQELAHRYVGLESFPMVIRMLPKKLLDDQKIQFLTRDRTLREVRGELSAARSKALASSAQLHAVLNTAGEGILTVDPAGSIVLANHEVHRIFGYAKDTLLGESVGRLFPKEAESSHLETFSSLVRAPEHFGERTEMHGVRANGTLFPLEICLQETMIGDQLFYTAALRDITERKRFQAELIAAKEHAEEMTRLKSAFLNKMSHELRTPLAGIIGTAQILDEEVAEEHREFIQMVETSGSRLSETLNAILDFAQLEAEGVELNVAPADIAQCLDAAVEPHRKHAEEKGLTLEVVCSAPERPVELDAHCFKRVAHIFVDNAIKFTERGSVTVRAVADAEGIRLSVEDTGIGISAEFIPHLFDEFKQESDGLSRSHQGSGLGLTIAQKLISRMGGTISVESQRGEGSTFTIHLPAHPVPTAPPPRSSGPAPHRHPFIL